MLEYEYFIGSLMIGVVWAAIFWIRKDLRKSMLWSSGVYAGIYVVGFVLYKILEIFFHVNSIIPGYWNPNTFFDLSRKTGGLAIEDIIFTFFIGGVFATFYYGLTNFRIIERRHHKHHFVAIMAGLCCAFLFSAFVKPNPVYTISSFGFFGAFVLVLLRKDLLKPAIFGGLIGAFLYTCLFAVFNTIFPDFIANFYNTNALMGVYILKVPVEEIIFAFATGLLWAPVYEYVHGARLARIK